MSQLTAEAEHMADMFMYHYGRADEWLFFTRARDYIDEYYSAWVEDKKNIDPDVGETAKLCAYYSPTWLSILIDDPEETGGWVSLSFSPFPEDTTGFEEIYPQDIAIYCARIDALRHPDHQDEIRPLFSLLHYDKGFKKFPIATAKFVISGISQRLKARLLFWKTPKWDRIDTEVTDPDGAPVCPHGHGKMVHPLGELLDPESPYCPECGHIHGESCSNGCHYNDLQ